jgi:EmrB/QacA subfamily drug resistance transporter
VTVPAADRRRLRLIAAALVSAILLSSLDGMIFNTALPTIVGQLHGIGRMSWVPTAYLLSTAITMPVYGKLGDLTGRKWLFVAALALFLCGSVVGGLAGSMTVLIAARAVQGLGAGGLMVLSQAIIADVVPMRERGRYMAVVGSVFIFSSVAGPLLGGWFTTTIGWRWAFWMNVPIALLAITAAITLLHPGRPAGRPRIDAPGIALMAVAVTALLLLTSLGGRTMTWTSPGALALGGLAVAAAAGFTAVERRAREPLIPPRLLADRDFALATAGGLCGALAMFGAAGYLPTYLQMVDGLTPTVAGLFMVPMVAGIGTTSFVSGHVMSRTGRYAWMSAAGAATVAVALGLLWALRVSTPPWVAGADAYVFGAGLGFGMQTLTIVAQNAFPAEVGTATAGFAFFREIGAALGAAAVGGIFTMRLTAMLADRLPARLADAHALTPALVASLPADVRARVAGAYHDALTPVFGGLAPMMLGAAVLLLFIRERPADSSSPAGAVSAEVGPPPAAGDLAAYGGEG